MTEKNLEAAAMRLSGRRRARLAARLIASLDTARDPGAQAAWAEEAARRDKAYRQGRHGAKPAEEVIRRLRAKLR
jgi:putative addiction module component (TIGR02574 family)